MILDEYVIMPNHVHGIIFIVDNDGYVGVQNVEPLQGRGGSSREMRNVNIMGIYFNRKLGWLGYSVSLNISRGKWALK